MRVQWTRLAVDDLQEIRIYIANQSPETAAIVADKILRAIELLPDFPRIGKSGRMQGTQELIVPGTPFVVIYRVRGTRLQVVRVIRGQRKWPPAKRKR